MAAGDSSTVDADRTVSDTYRGELLEWLLLEGDRRLIAFGIAGAFAIAFTVLVRLEAVPLTNLQALFYVYSGLIAGNLTLITVVVSINQLLLGRELQTPGELQDQIQSVIEFREDVEDATGEIAPVQPMGFLRLLVEGTREEAQRLGGLSRDGVVRDGTEEIEDLVAKITRRMDEVDALLTESDTGTFGVLSVLLETNYAPQINRLRRVQASHESDVDDVVHDSIDDLIDRLQEIDVARQYFKSIYLQQELSALSRVLLYAGVPAVGTAIAALFTLTVPPGGPGTVVELRILLPLTVTIGLLPLSLLCSYFLRMATVTKLTAATLPFTTPEQER